MKEEVFINANDTDFQKVHQIRVDFIADGISQVNAFSFIQPTCDGTPPDPITPPDANIPFYAASTGYNVGDFVKVDRGNVISTYRCTQDYTSGAGGGWLTFRTELAFWTHVKDELPPVTINFLPKS
jgi:hypothetical protein